jgi:hypothetical protein
MLVRAHNGGLNDHVFVVMFTRQQLENTLENSILRPSTEALMHDLPIAKTLREIPPGNAGSISVENGFHEQSIVGCSPSHMTFAADQQKKRL